MSEFFSQLNKPRRFMYTFAFIQFNQRKLRTQHDKKNFGYDPLHSVDAMKLNGTLTGN